MIEGKLYLQERVENKDRRFGSNKEYFPVIVRRFDGQEVPALFTDHDITAAIERAKVNPEDVPEDKSFWDILLGR